MAIRVKHKLVVQNSSDEDAYEKLFYLEDNSGREVVIDGFDQQANSTLRIPASGSQSLGFGDVTDVRGLYLEVNRDCYLRLNGSIDNIPLKLPPGITAAKAKLFMEADLNAIVIENLDTVNALIGVYCVWGDVTP